MRTLSQVLAGGLLAASSRGARVLSDGVTGAGLQLGFHSAGMRRQLDSMGSTGILFQIVSTFASSISLAPWTLQRTPGPGSDPLVPPAVVGRHLALDLWRHPNRFMTGQQLVEVVQQHVELVGEGYLLVDRDARLGVPSGLWPIRPDRMEPVPHPTDYLSGWLYRGPAGEQIPLGLDEVIQIRQPHPMDPYRGFGAVQAIMAELDTSAFSAAWNRQFFLNGARPMGIVEVPMSTRNFDIDRFREQWAEKYQGVRNAHRVAILESGATWKDTQFSARDMQLVEIGKATRDTIREAFGISKTMLGQTEDVNRATAEAAMMVFARDRRKPRLERWRQALNHGLLPMYGRLGEGVEFTFDPEIPDDEAADAAELKSKTEGAKTLIDAGWAPGDVLRVVGLPDMEFVGPAGRKFERESG